MPHFGGKGARMLRSQSTMRRDCALLGGEALRGVRVRSYGSNVLLRAASDVDCLHVPENHLQGGSGHVCLCTGGTRRPSGVSLLFDFRTLQPPSRPSDARDTHVKLTHPRRACCGGSLEGQCLYGDTVSENVHTSFLRAAITGMGETPPASVTISCAAAEAQEASEEEVQRVS